MKRKGLLVICLTLALLLLFSSTGFAFTSVKVTKLMLDDTTLSMLPGKSLTVTYTVLPSNASDKKISWSSSNSKVAKVSSKGVITAVKEGNAVISVKTSNKSVSQKVNVTVIKKVVKLDLFTEFGNLSGVQKKWSTNILRDKVGVEINFLPTGDNIQAKYQTLLAGGELPDVIFVSNINMEDAIRAKMLLCLDDAKIKAKIPNVFKLPAASLQYIRDNKSFNTGKLYTAPADIGRPKKSSFANWGPSIRWDLYKKIGMPKMYTMEDYIPVLKKMMKVEPKNAAGNKNYGISLFKDWDGNHMFMAENFCQVLGISVDTNLNEIDYKEAVYTPKSLLDADSTYIRALKFFFKANQEGVLDPESMTQNWSTIWDKATVQERIFFTFWGWCDNNTVERNNDPVKPRGTMFVLPKEAKPLSQYFDTLLSTRGYGISKSTKNLDAVLRYIDYSFSWNGAFVMVNGPRGLVWDVDKNGLPYVTKQGWAIKDSNKELPLPNGGLLSDGPIYSAVFGGPNGFSLYEGTYNCAISGSDWDSSIARNAKENKILKSYEATTGYKDNVDMLFKTGQVTLQRSISAVNFLPKVPDDIQAIINKVGDILKTESWKMVYAKNQSQFDSMYKAMYAKAKGLGLQKVTDWSKKVYKEANAKAAKYQKAIK